jgi:hypothetical protein
MIRRVISAAVLFFTKRIEIQEIAAIVKENSPGMRAPLRPINFPTYTPAKLGIAVIVKINPAPLDDHLNVSITNNGSVYNR